MQKDFDGWNSKKKRIEPSERERLVFHEREIWWCSIGLNIGDEQDGKNEMFERPALVLKKFNNKIAWVLPMTSQRKEGIYYYNLTHVGENSSVILSQLRLLSSKRFLRLIRKISPNQFSFVQEKLIKILLDP